jgi:hypothetical protein
MHRDLDHDYFLLAAMDWAALRAAVTPDTRAYLIATVVSREAAVCHLLFQAGRLAEVVGHLRAVCREMLGVTFPEPGRHSAPDAARALGTAADLFHRLRLAAGADSCAEVG